MKPTEGMEIAGRYRLLRPLAKGGMGQIWVAEHIELEVEIAVKFLSDELAQLDKSRDRFKREARAAAQLKSPHVTSIIDYGLFEGTPFIAMELLDGEDLRARLRRVGKMSLEQTLAIVEPVCQALELAHQRGIVHRDLKPPNIFIAQMGHGELVKVLDFGIAKETKGERLVASDGTESGALLGSPRYMSPEQALGDRIDHRTDLWAIGCVTYEMLAGRAVFPSSNIAELFSAILNDDVPSVRERTPELPEAIEDFFRCALARAVDDRFSSASEMSAALRAIANGDAMPPRDRDASSITTAADGTRLSGTDAEEEAGEEAKPLAEAPAKAAPAERADDTTPGVGLDTGMVPPRRGRWLVAAAALVLIGVVGWRFSASDGPAPAASASAPLATSATPATDEPEPAASTELAPSATASASASATAKTAKPPPVVRRPPPAAPPPAAPPKPPPPTTGPVDDFTGLPIK